MRDSCHSVLEPRVKKHAVAGPTQYPKGAKIFDVVAQGVTELNIEFQSLEMLAT